MIIYPQYFELMEGSVYGGTSEYRHLHKVIIPIAEAYLLIKIKQIKGLVCLEILTDNFQF